MKTIGTIESITGGKLAAAITSVPGASKFFKGSIVTYTNEIKEKLGIDTSNGVINKKMALAMAKAGKNFLGVDICIALTGNAGPTTIDSQPVGKVFIAINDNVFEKDFSGDRKSIREQCVLFAINKLNLKRT